MSLDNEKNSQLEKLKEENQILKNQLKEHSRELQIEAAVERVRVQAMSMQSSNDFSHVMRKIWDEIGDLSIEGFSGTSVLLFDEENTYMYDFSSIGNIGDPSEKVVSYLHKKKKVMQEPWEMWKKKVQYHEMHMDYTDPKDVKSVDDEWKDIDTSIHHNFLSAIESGELKEQWNTFGYFPQGYISFDFLTKPDEHAKQITIKMANAMALAFKRYEDLQIAETQTREAQIEAALERVRSRTMAMQHSNELAEASHLLDKEVRNLGIKTWGCAFNIYREKDSIEWFGNEKGVLPTYTIPRKGIFKKYFDAGKKGKSFHVQEFKGQKCIDHYEYMSTLPVIGDVLRQLKKTNGSFPEYQIDHVAFFKYGYLLFITIEKVPEAHDIFKRFASLFEQTYTRFLDLQKAEAQAREAQIEASLESVRARSMAMYHSDELGEVITLIFEKLGSLDISVGDGVALITFSEGSKDLNEWMITKGLGKAMNFHLPYFDHPVLSNLWEAKNRGEEQFSYTYSKKESKSFLKYIFEQTDFIHTPEDVKEYCLAAESYTTTFAFQKHTAIFINDYLGGSLTESELAILERFSKVFEQTYTRFLDLQKAEAQAREAKIEAALERVRSQAMAMQRSEELGMTIEVYFEQLANLFESKVVRCGAGLLNKENTMADITSASRNDAGEIYHVRGSIDMSGHPMTEATYNHWQKQNEYNVVLKGNEIRDYYRHVTNQVAIPENSKGDELHFCFPMFEEGSIYIITKEALSEESLIVFRRFSSVISLTYRRFSDLKKAESQAREAQIEAAVERVRSEAMAMHHPSDLVNVTQILIKEITNIGIQGITGAAFILVNEDDIVTMWDISDPGNMGYTRDNKSVYDPREFKMLGEFWRKWKKGDEYFVIKYDLEKNKKGLEEWKLVDEENYENLKRAIEQNKLKTQWNPFGSFSKGLLTLDMMTEPDTDTEKIVVKMARTFDLAYQRFDDLQKAEEQAREAKEQASLDRIRAEIGSMRNQKDLETITPLIWSELSALGVPFFRCGVFIIDQAIQKVQLYLSTPNGKSIAAITMDFNSNEVADDVVANWRKQSIYKDEWDREEFIAWSKDLLEQGLIPNVKEYQHDETPPERLFLQFVPFKQGMLYIGTDHFLSEDHMELIQDIADDFSIAYSRYEDFMSLEKAKHMAENALGELRSTQTQLVHAEKMASLGELTAGIAHEIQNPLNFVNNFSDLNRELIDELSEALESGDMDEVKELLVDLKANEQKIIHHGKRAEDIVRGMLQHSRTGDGKKELTNLNALADEYLRLSYHGLRAKDKSFNADFKCTLDKTLPKVNVVPQDLGRVILNLINNAFHAVSQKSKASDNDYSPIVEVLTINKNDSIDLIVKDNGAGISDNIKVKIFQPFFTTKATGEGTGLGLSLSYDIITKGHGGSIKVESKEGEGSEFIINLPII